MPNQILPIEMPISLNRKTDQVAVTSTTTRSLMMTTGGPIYHLRFHRSPRFGLANLGASTRNRCRHGLTVATRPTPLNRALKSDVKASAIATLADTQVTPGKNPPKPSKSQGAFLRDRIKRLEFLIYFLFTLLLVETGGLLTDFLLKVLTSQN